MSVILGSDFMISITIDNIQSVVCHATDCIIDQNVEVREITGPQSAHRDYIADRIGYTISFPALVDYSDDLNYIQLQNAMMKRLRLPWAASASLNGGVVHSGTLIITGLSQTSQMRDVMKFDFSAIGCGELITRLLPIIKNVFLADFNGQMLIGCPNPYPIIVYWYDFTPIGPAVNADDVVNIFNNYIENQRPAGGLWYTLSIGDTGCNFTMSIAYDAPLRPNVIYAKQGAEIALWQGINNAVISNDQDNNNVISPICLNPM